MKKKRDRFSEFVHIVIQETRRSERRRAVTEEQASSIQGGTLTDANRMREIDVIFHEAVERTGTERSKYLDEACRGDENLRSQIESLLEADEGPSIGLDRPLVEMFPLCNAAVVTARPEVPKTHLKRDFKEIQCERGHFYDPGKHHFCPYCGIRRQGVASDLPASRISGNPEKVSTPSAVMNEPIRQPVKADDSPTQWRDSDGEAGASPIHRIAGWLVCVHGPECGRDYQIRAQRNFIGRDPQMDICIAGDPTISRKKHAVISFDPRSNEFRIAPGEANGLVYVNKEIIDIPTALRPYDIIELGPAGTTRLVFVPLCGEKFHW